MALMVDDDSYDGERTCGYGISWADTKKLAKEFFQQPLSIVSVEYGEVRDFSCGMCNIFSMRYDCGMLNIGGLNYKISDTYLDFVDTFASRGGFSTLLGSIAVPTDEIERLITYYTEKGWEVVSKKHSNRNAYKIHVVLLKHILCEKKGY